MTRPLPPEVAPAAGLLLDDRSTGSADASGGGRWRFFTDGVMGGVSSGAMTVATVDGRAALCLRGQVRLDNQGGFIQMALELAPPSGLPLQGVELDVQGNGRHYGVHLRTDAMTAPWQAWRARFAAPPRWQTVRLPFEAFEPYRTGGTLDPARIRRIGLVAIGEAGEAALCVGRVAFF